MKDFKNGKIYEVVCNKTGKRYVGSTAETRLSSRMSKHRCDYKRWKEGKGNNCGSYDILAVDDYEYHTIEHYECETKHALLMRESYWYYKYKELYGDLCVNRNVPLHTVESRKEMNDECAHKWKVANKDKTKKYAEQYYAANKDKVKKQNEKWSVLNPDRKKELNAKWKGVKVMCEYCNELTSKQNIRKHQCTCVANGGGLLKINI
tara:strand:+ start:1364 stop:1981 length:618 start_codon:yes stop_codon:yes gene_type:complete